MWTGSEGSLTGFGGLVLGYLLRMFIVCAALYVFFLNGMLGAGDIKLMAAAVGWLGFSKGLLVLFWGFLGAAAWGILLLILRRELGKRLLGLFSYIASCIRERRLLIFPGQSKETEPLRLGVFLFLGYLASGLM